MGRATVLVVNDERKIREVVCSYLEREGYAVLQADTGQRALEAVQRGAPDLVVLDLMLPDLSGEEVTRSIRSVSRVPIIILTAKADPNDRVAGLKLGADDYVVKPFSPRELVARVEAVLRRGGGVADAWPSDSSSPSRSAFGAGTAIAANDTDPAPAPPTSSMVDAMEQMHESPAAREMHEQLPPELRASMDEMHGQMQEMMRSGRAS